MKLRIPSSPGLLTLLLIIWAIAITYNNYRVKDMYVETLDENVNLYVQNAVLNHKIRELYIENMHLRNLQEQLLDTVKDTNRSFALLIRSDLAN